MSDKSVSEPLGTSTGTLGQTSPTAETAPDDQSAREPHGASTGNLGPTPSTVERVADDQTVDQLLSTSIGNLGQPPRTEGIAQVPTRPSVAASPEATSQPPPAKRAWSMGKWFRLPGSQLVAEKLFAWHASRELLDLYKRIQLEEPQLTGRTLYERVVIRRSGLDVQAAVGVLRRAEESFCDWPSGSDLKFHDLVQYVVIDEYLRSHVGTVGTRTNMVKVVAGIIPHDL